MLKNSHAVQLSYLDTLSNDKNQLTISFLSKISTTLIQLNFKIQQKFVFSFQQVIEKNLS